MRKIKLEFKLNNLPEVDLLEFSNLLKTFDLINNLGYEIIDKNEFLSKNIEDYYSTVFLPEIRPGFSTINKQSPIIIEIIFGSIGAFWILIQIVDKIRSWKLDRDNVQNEEKKLEPNTEIDNTQMFELQQKVYEKLKKIENQIVLNKIIDELEKNILSVEGLKVIEEMDGRNQQISTLA